MHLISLSLAFNIGKRGREKFMATIKVRVRVGFKVGPIRFFTDRTMKPLLLSSAVDLCYAIEVILYFLQRD